MIIGIKNQVMFRILKLKLIQEVWGRNLFCLILADKDHLKEERMLRHTGRYYVTSWYAVPLITFNISMEYFFLRKFLISVLLLDSLLLTLLRKVEFCLESRLPRAQLSLAVLSSYLILEGS